LDQKDLLNDQKKYTTCGLETAVNCFRYVDYHPCIYAWIMLCLQVFPRE